MKTFKAAAFSLGYDLWYDRQWKVWMCTKDGFMSLYFSADEIRRIGIKKFFDLVQINPESPY